MAPDATDPDQEEGMPIMGSRIAALIKWLRGNPRPMRRQRLFGNRIAWAVATVRAARRDWRDHRANPHRVT